MAYSGAICIIDTITHAVNIEVEYGTHLTDLVATFTLSEGAVAKVGDIVQKSEITANDFTNPLIYTITAEDGLTVQDWIVTIIQINTTPILVMELGNAELEVEEFYEFDLDDIFSDPDGDPLSFSAVSSDDAIATA